MDTLPENPGTDEFALLTSNAAELGLDATSIPHVERVTTRVGEHSVSAIVWGVAEPEFVFLHGGAQNAHTWDSMLLALGAPAVAIDLPGHGHSSWRGDRDYAPRRNAETIAAVIDALAPSARAVVGMSLGGLTTIGLLGLRPQLVRHAVIVDVTPSVYARHQAMSTAQRGTTALPAGPRHFDSLDDMVSATAALAPHRSIESIRRGVIHNSRPAGQGGYQWRYDALTGMGGFLPLWDEVARARCPITLVRGGDSVFVADDDIDEFRSHASIPAVHTVPGAGHSVQSDQPRALARILRELR